MAQEVRIGAKLHNFGAAVEKVPLTECAVVAEEAGYDSVWLSDHVVLPSEVSSPYPFTDDHLIDWPVDTPFYDAVVSMSTVAAVTHRIEVGMGVLVLAVRHPLVIAKQIASLDAWSRGRIVLAVGAGWLAEEYDILGVPFETRGSRLDEWIHLLRDCWTGTPAAFEGKHFRLPEGVLRYPTPARGPDPHRWDVARRPAESRGDRGRLVPAAVPLPRRGGCDPRRHGAGPAGGARCRSGSRRPADGPAPRGTHGSRRPRTPGPRRRRRH